MQRNQTLMALDAPTFPETWLLSSVRYESELHNHAVVHPDGPVLPDNVAEPLATRRNHIEQYGALPGNYEITYAMHNQQPWAKRSDKPCLVTYNPVGRIDDAKVVERRWSSTSSTTCATSPCWRACSASCRAGGGPSTGARTR